MSKLPPTREFVKKYLPSSLEKKTYYSSITVDNQEKFTEGVEKFENQFREYKHSGNYDLYTAAIALEVKTGKIIGHYGGQGVTDLTTLNPGFPMASLIKPFYFTPNVGRRFRDKSLRWQISRKSTRKL